jgi:hypothetical protein
MIFSKDSIRTLRESNGKRSPGHDHKYTRLPAVVFLLFLMLGCSGPSGPLQFAPSDIWLTSTIFGVPMLADVNGDARADLLVFKQGGQSGPVHVALSNGSRFGPLQQWHGNFCVGSEICATGDVNGDGKADILAFVHGDGQEPRSALVWVALSDGTKFSQASVWNNGFCITEQTCSVGDINGDKRADIVAYTPKFGLVWASLSTGVGFGANAVWQKYFCILGEVCTLGDVDGDGKSDAILFKPNAPPGQKGNVLWAPSSGSGFGAPKLGHGYFCIDQERCFVADFSADKRADVMLLKRPFPWESLVSLSNGSQFINPNPFIWSGNIPGYAGDVGDVNGDGRADVMTYEHPGGSTANGTRYYVTLTTDGSRSTSPDDQSHTRGVSRVEFFNCVPEHRPLYFWVTDMTTGQVNPYGPIDDVYDSSGNCPAADSEPFDVNLIDQHDYRIVAVDPGGQSCGANDPSNLACQRQVYWFRGKSGGGTIQVIVPAAAP